MYNSFKYIIISNIEFGENIRLLKENSKYDFPV